MVTRGRRRLSSGVLGRPRGGVRGPRRRFDRELVCDRCGCTYLSKRTPYQVRAFCSGACRTAAWRDRAKAEAAPYIPSSSSC